MSSSDHSTGEPTASNNNITSRMLQHTSDGVAMLSQGQKMSFAELNSMRQSSTTMLQTNHVIKNASSSVNITAANYNASNNTVAVAPSASTPEDYLGDDDVILGRGKNPMNSTGNRRLKDIVVPYKHRYQHEMNKIEKTKLSRDIVRQVQQRGGRFLVLNNSTDRYEVVSDTAAREKVSHLLRAKSEALELRKKRYKNKHQHKSSSTAATVTETEWGFPKRKSRRTSKSTVPNSTSAQMPPSNVNDEDHAQIQSINGLLKKQKEIFSRISTGADTFRQEDTSDDVARAMRRNVDGTNNNKAKGTSAETSTGNAAVNNATSFTGLLEMQKHIFSQMNTSQDK